MDNSGGLIIDNPSVDILALEPGEPLSTNSVSTKARNDPQHPSPFTFWSFALFGSQIATNSIPNSTFSTAACTPTFARPCAISYFVPLDQQRRLTVEHRQIVDLFIP